jgi:hypothetical protein
MTTSEMYARAREKYTALRCRGESVPHTGGNGSSGGGGSVEFPFAGDIIHRECVLCSQVIDVLID